MHNAQVELPDEPGLPTSADPYPPSLTISLEKVETLPLRRPPLTARYRRTDREPRPGEGPFATGEPPLQGKALSYNVLDASAAAGLARLMRGPAVVICKRTQTLLSIQATHAARRPGRRRSPGDPVSAYGGVVAVTGTIRALAEAMGSIFLEVIVAPAFGEERTRGARRRRPTCAWSWTRRWAPPPSSTAVDYLSSAAIHRRRRARDAPDSLPDDPASGRASPRRQPTEREARRPRPRLAPLPRCRVQRDLLVPQRHAHRPWLQAGLGVDACRQAVEKARTFPRGRARGAAGAVAASDAFFPFADGPTVLLEAGVTAIVQPGGSIRDAEVLRLVEDAGAAMLITRKRHFRH
ncbi:MAG: hypothetical protein U0838_10635 [Chloroflexota bacterium]